MPFRPSTEFRELLINRPSVQDIIDFARDSVQSGSVTIHNDDAPLSSYAPHWMPRPLPTLPAQHDVSQKQVHIIDAQGIELERFAMPLAQPALSLPMVIRYPDSRLTFSFTMRTQMMSSPLGP